MIGIGIKWEKQIVKQYLYIISLLKIYIYLHRKHKHFNINYAKF